MNINIKLFYAYTGETCNCTSNLIPVLSVTCVGTALFISHSHGRRKDFFQGCQQWIFSGAAKGYFRGDKNGEISVQTKKTTFKKIFLLNV